MTMARPEPEPFITRSPAAPAGHGWADTAAGWLNTIPGWVWLAAVTALFLGLLVMRSRLDRAYRVNPPKTGDNLGGLFTAAVLVAAVLWAGILAVSGKNLTGFARDTLDFTGGWEYSILAGLDGIAVAFAVVMFAAVRAGRSANRAYRIVWSATLMSAVIGAWHGYDGNTGSIAAAALLGYFALAAMAVLHELLDLFRSTTEKKAPRVRPAFGLRWVTYFPNTLCAALAWENHPPRPLAANATPDQVLWYGSVRHAVAHLDVVRRAKRVHRYAPAGADPAAGWARVLPWLRVRQLDAALLALRVESVTELAGVRAQAADDLARIQSELDATRRQLTEMTALFETASTELDQAKQDQRVSDVRANACEQQAANARAALEEERRYTAGQAAAAKEAVAAGKERIGQLDVALGVAREEIGRLRADLAAMSATAERAAADAADARDLLAAREAAHRDELTATVDRLTRQREQVSSLPAAAPARPRPARPAAEQGARGGQPAAAPSSPPWNEQQTEAFELRDSNPQVWTWPALADRYGVATSTVRRWFDNRRKHQEAPVVPATPIPDPKPPAIAGANGTTLHH